MISDTLDAAANARPAERREYHRRERHCRDRRQGEDVIGEYGDPAGVGIGNIGGPGDGSRP